MTERTACRVAICTNTMPVGFVMCAHCWAKVDESIRAEIQSLKNGNARRAQLVAIAVNQAQASL